MRLTAFAVVIAKQLRTAPLIITRRENGMQKMRIEMRAGDLLWLQVIGAVKKYSFFSGHSLFCMHLVLLFFYVTVATFAYTTLSDSFLYGVTSEALTLMLKMTHFLCSFLYPNPPPNWTHHKKTGNELDKRPRDPSHYPEARRTLGKILEPFIVEDIEPIYFLEN